MDASPCARPTVAVIGAGFSGLMTALHLLENPRELRVLLIERRGAFACGAAYSTTFKDHLLNVRAANMSAYPDRPDHFANWLAAEASGEIATAFARRSQYGAYLQAMLANAVKHSGTERLQLLAGSVIGLKPSATRWCVQFDDGKTATADAVVLSVGNFPPHVPPGIEAEASESVRFVSDPWSIPSAIMPEVGQAVLIGTGLTMVDTALRLASERPGLKMLAISRRGLLPHQHLPTGPSPLSWGSVSTRSARALIRQIRMQAKSADWRSVIDGLRPQVQSIWRRWPAGERERFLRHARPWWDIHRHRLAPDVAGRLAGLVAEGSLTTAAGRFHGVTKKGEGFLIRWRRRGERTINTLDADLIINCSGPMGQLARSADPLIRDLARQQLIRSDQQGLGLDVDVLSRPLSGTGKATPTLFSVGPITRGAFWEITSVPDIRVQAKHCADNLAAELSSLELTPQP